MTSRPAKLSHSQTILYEIDLLCHSAKKLAENCWGSPWEEYVYLENFLLHYRNLIEFFGRKNPRPDDLHITRTKHFWPKLESAQDKEVRQSLSEQGKKLWEKYEEKPDRISKYLQHCTEVRTEPRDWDYDTMYKELRPVLEKFEQLLPDKSRPWSGRPSQTNRNGTFSSTFSKAKTDS